MYQQHGGYTNGVNGMAPPHFPNQQRPGFPPQPQYPNGNSKKIVFLALEMPLGMLGMIGDPTLERCDLIHS